jgi:hypothetical protein
VPYPDASTSPGVVGPNTAEETAARRGCTGIFQGNWIVMSFDF